MTFRSNLFCTFFVIGIFLRNCLCLSLVSSVVFLFLLILVVGVLRYRLLVSEVNFTCVFFAVLTKCKAKIKPNFDLSCDPMRQT